ncbi:MAG: T9SS type A sorting domain-containing protein [Flavobacteriales bacterium]|nr:T9SS type A sorting domain-containing protein [Flavobacteriales bacterium]
MIRLIACFIAILALPALYGQGGETFMRVLSNHVGNFGIDMVTPSVLFQRSDSSFMIFGRIREGADRYYPVYQQYDRKGGIMQSKDFNPGFSTLNYGHGSTFETSDGGIIHRGGTGWQGEQVIIKFDSKLNEQWRITADSTISSSRNLVENNNHLVSAFVRYTSSGSYETLLKISLDSGRIIQEKTLTEICPTCDTTFSATSNLTLRNGNFYFNVIEDGRGNPENYKYWFVKMDDSLKVLNNCFIPLKIGTEYSNPVKLYQANSLIFLYDSAKSSNQFSTANIVEDFTNFSVQKNVSYTNKHGKILANYFTIYDNNYTYLDYTICNTYEDTNQEFCATNLVQLDEKGKLIRSFPLNHKDSTGRYRYYNITNLQKTLEGGFVFTFRHPGGGTDAPWYLVVTDSNMLINSKPFWHKFYSGDTNKTIEISEDGQKFSVGVFPIPVDEKLNISFNKSLNASFELRDLNGLTLLIGQFENSVRLDVSNIPNGIYFLQIRGEGILETRKVIVSH